MFDGLISNRFGGSSREFLDAFEGFTGQTQRFIGAGEEVQPLEPVDTGAFGAIASYQVCACCARFHGPTSETSGDPVSGLNADDRGVFGPNGKPSLSSTDAGAQITRSNQSWATGLGTAATVTYAFRDSVTTMPTDTQGFTQFNAAQIAATALAMAAWSDVANITFQRVQDAGSQYSNNATILLGNYATGQEGAAAFAYLPGGMPGGSAANQVQGDVWINSSFSYNVTPIQQGYGQLTLLHEIGHAIGLSHPAAYNASADGNITYSGSAIYYEDSLQYSVMSYFSEVNTGADFRINGQGTRAYSSAPLLDDISAAQRLYGANMSTRTGNTTYGFNSNAGQLWFNAAFEGAPLVFCAWDAGGTDTFDFSGYTMAQTIDLRQGSFSNVGGMIGNVSIALGAVIENAIGGAGSDTFRGNSANNRFTPNAGTDVVDGGLGTDTVVFSGARSAYTITWNGQVGTIVGNGQNVTVTNVESLQFTDQTIAATPTGGVTVGGDITNETITGTAFADVIGGLGGIDTINGLAGNDTLNGGSGGDTLNGGDDNDILIGGLGNDTLNGGAGVDTADYSGAGAGVTVNLTTGAAEGGAGLDTLSLVENVTGTALNDTITGDGNANILRGGGGIDTISGGGGADELYAGAPGAGGGAPDIEKGPDSANGSIGTAISLTGAFDLHASSAIANATTIPHATVNAVSHGGVEYYAITVVAGETVRFDIDNASFDSTLRLMTAGGVELANNDDDAADGGSATDSALSHTFASAGTYYIQVARWLTNVGETFTSGAPPAGSTYTLHVSSPSQTPVPIVMVGSTMNGDAGADQLEGGAGLDTLNGGADDDLLIGAGGNDTINGGEGTDTAVYSGNRSAYTISVSGGVTTVTGADGTDSVSNVERLQFADGIYNAAGEPVGGPINGTAGADTLNGTEAADVMNGFGGDDVLSGFGGDDTLNGGDGSDTLLGGAGADTIDGGAGTDWADYSNSADRVVVNLSAGTALGGDAHLDVLIGIENLNGTNSTLKDILTGDSAVNILNGLGGDDELRGLGGNDILGGGSGNDLLDGGVGADTLDGGSGNDTADYSNSVDRVAVNLSAGTALGGDAHLDVLTSIENLTGTNSTLKDFLTGSSAVNILSGLGGDDDLRGLAGDDILMGGSGNDLLDGGVGADTIDGGSGNDTADYSNSVDRVAINLSAGTALGGDAHLDVLSGIENLTGTNSTLKDVLTGDSAVNILSGLAGDDDLRGLGGDDILMGGSGNDLLDGGVGADTIDGGSGNDTADYSTSADRVVINLSAGTALGGDAHLDVLSGIENLTGTNSTLKDILTGDSAVNILSGLGGDDDLRGLAGDDILLGGSGNDLLDGGVGADTIDGGSGNDTADYSTSADRVVVNLSAGTALGGDAHLDVLSGIENLTGTNSTLKDVLTGDSAVNILSGLGGDDELRGLGGNDFLIGGSGNDLLDGGVGADTIDGGSGNDTADYSNSVDRVAINLSAGTALGGDAHLDVLSGIENLTGTNSTLKDFLTGNSAVNILSGLGGDDDLRGLAGDDFLLGGSGNDLLDGGVGADTLDGGSGTDTADYSNSVDRVAVNLSAGTALGGDAHLDVLTSIENLTGTNSTLKDFLTGSSAVNILSGLGGDDDLRGLAGDDILMGGSGNDLLDGGVGADTIDGGSGNDTADYSNSVDRVAINLSAGTALGGDAHLDVLSGIENLTGTNSTLKDVLTGDSAVNILSGLAGDDELSGLGGDDSLIGGAGNDLLEGGDGTDTAVFSGNRSAYVIMVTGSVVTVSGPDGVDTLTGIERLQFADMVTNPAGDMLAMPAPELAAPLVLPALADNTAKDSGPQVLPAGFDEGTKGASGPQVQPAIRDGSAKDVGPQVLPGVEDIATKDVSPQVLPGESEVFPTRVSDRRYESDLASDRDVAATLSMFGDGASGDSYLFGIAGDPDQPEVLPGMDDDFILSAKFEAPPVIPPLQDDLDGGGMVKEMHLARSLSGEIRLNPNTSDDGLTLFDDGAGIAPPIRDDIWG